MTSIKTSVITLPYPTSQPQDTPDMQFLLGATLSLEGELKAERARTKSLKNKLQVQAREHLAEQARFVGQNARLNQEVQALNAQLGYTDEEGTELLPPLDESTELPPESQLLSEPGADS